MKILIYGVNFSPELTGIGKYTGEMAEWLAEQGYDIHVITAPPYYPAWKISKGYSVCRYTRETAKKITITRCPIWVPAQPKAFTRIIHLLSFAFFSVPVLFKQVFFWRPEVVVSVAPPFFCTPQTVLFSKFAGVKSWLHFQDFEICAMFGSGMVPGGERISDILHKIQSSITRRFDIVSTISYTMCLSAEKKKVNKDRVILFPNWVDTTFLTPNADGSYFRGMWEISAEKKVVLYSGNLGKKQGLDCLIEAASALRHREDILFVVVGDGAHKYKLMGRCREMEVKNMQFYSLQPYELLPSLLCMADIHLIIQKRGTADAVLPSKLTSVLSVGGHSIITAEPDTELGRIVSDNPGIATLIPPEEMHTLVNTIVQLCNRPEIGEGQVNKVARNYAVNKLGKEEVLKKFERDLIQLTDN